jgi:hypothetical protein
MGTIGQIASELKSASWQQKLGPAGAFDARSSVLFLEATGAGRAGFLSWLVSAPGDRDLIVPRLIK